MLVYNYTARDPATGDKVKGQVQASDEQTVAKTVKERGLALIDVKAEGGGGGLLGSFTNRVRAKDKVIFSRQLATLINAGLPLVQSLRSVRDQTKSKPLKVILNQVITDVEAGKAFSEALAVHPQVFNQIFVSLVAAGETSGTLDKALERIANQQEKDAELVSKVRGAMVYPVLVLLVMAGVVSFMLVSVLPQVQDLYDGLPGTQLPFITVWLLALSNFMINYWWIILLVLAGLVGGGSKYARSAGGKRLVDIIKLRLWPVAALFQKMYMARFARTATTLVATGVPLIQVLNITKRVVSNIYIEDAITAATERVKGGAALSDSLMGNPYFVDLVPQMLKIGEDSGAIEQMLEKTADYFEKEVDNQVKTISTIIEPVLMIILGVVALTIVAAILLPIYGLVGQGVF